MIAIAARLAVPVTVIWLAFEAAGFLTGSPVFMQTFWGAVSAVLIAAAVLAGAAVAIAAVAFGVAALLLSSHSPIPRVRSYWTRRLTPDRAAGQTARSAATTQETSTS